MASSTTTSPEAKRHRLPTVPRPPSASPDRIAIRRACRAAVSANDTAARRETAPAKAATWAFAPSPCK